ncbi:peptidoglycan/LPS O-acetylase OafA/YrhL [Rhodoblastus acidophilus]|uniref:acyltransferase family protein n=1 Tax=Rhodoblastus acidophilus TaxID=1074 RepID=UPI0022246DF4|nr:acyltransferase [Rhodoblastus acidophilus]MCW2282933.1 peptidoglycan/LPS O-acetylase OafA/YrhL [Rhodoblastus acidophilus]MCW2331794.1 peptidoglycan/LPS O-acetylase OafA/YrhL [Rhodoblastus acidophilus]
MRKYIGLEVIRALAALLVVYNHVFTFGLVPKTGLIELPTQFATEAVIIFFVLSGTVITLSAERKSATAPSRFAATISYLQARLLRIYPIYFFGLVLATIDQAWFENTWTTARDFIGNALFLQTLAGYIVPTPRYNPPLWSLANEVFYYLIFAVSFYCTRVIVVWAIVAFLCAVFLYPPHFGGVPAHLVFVLGLSLPWIMGHWIAAWRDHLPRVSVPLGFAFFVIGLCYARVQLTSEYYDAFRLTAFGACCCPLILSLIQNPVVVEKEPQHRAWRFLVSLIGISALWAFSPSLFVVKVGLTVLSLLFSALNVEHIQTGLTCFRALVPALSYVGSISYALYVLHAPLIFIVNHMLAKSSVTVRLAVFGAVALALSHLMERVIQKRLTTRGWTPRLEST